MVAWDAAFVPDTQHAQGLRDGATAGARQGSDEQDLTRLRTGRRNRGANGATTPSSAAGSWTWTRSVLVVGDETAQLVCRVLLDSALSDGRARTQVDLEQPPERACGSHRHTCASSRPSSSCSRSWRW